MSTLADELLRILHTSEDGLSDEQIKDHFGSRYEELVPAINQLLGLNRLLLFTQGSSLVYKAVREETAAKFEGLGPEQMLVYQTVERSGNKGIWTRDIKIATNIAQHNLTKTLKILEQRLLVKSVRSVVSKSKKLYMAYDIMPAKEITGGPWYSDQEFDHEFVNALSNFIVQVIKSTGLVDLQTITEKVRISGFSKIELSVEEIDLVVNTLVFDGRLEEVSTAALVMAGQSSARKRYKASKSQVNALADQFTDLPCGRCPVSSQCSENGLISPKSCVYFEEWLGSAQGVYKDVLMSEKPGIKSEKGLESTEDRLSW